MWIDNFVTNVEAHGTPSNLAPGSALRTSKCRRSQHCVRSPRGRSAEKAAAAYAVTVATADQSAFIAEFLSNIDFFDGFSPAAKAAVVADTLLLELQRGDVLFTDSDPADNLYVVHSGRIAMANRSADGRESILAFMTTGDLFGEMPLFDGSGRSAGARALESSEVLQIPYGPVRAEFATNAAAIWQVVSLLVGRLRATDEALADSVFLDVTGRTAKRLLEMAGDRSEFQLPVTQEELAAMIGASRERVNKAIAQFVRLGWLDQSERTYRIVDRKKLEIRAS